MATIKLDTQQMLSKLSINRHLNWKYYKQEIVDDFKDWDSETWKYIMYDTLYFLLPEQAVLKIILIKDWFKNTIRGTMQRFGNLTKYGVFLPSHYGYSLPDILLEQSLSKIILYRGQYFEDKKLLQYQAIPTWIDKKELHNRKYGLNTQDILTISNYLDDPYNSSINSHLLSFGDLEIKQVDILHLIWKGILDNMIYGLSKQSNIDWSNALDEYSNFDHPEVKLISDKQEKAKSDFAKYWGDMWI